MLSCNEVLDMPSDGRVNLKEIFSDFDLSRGYVNKCYSYMPGGGITGDYAMTYDGTLLASFCDEAQDVQDAKNGNVQNWYLGNASANSFPIVDYWSLYYQGIRTCNIFLREIDAAPFLVSRPSLKGEVRDWKAQVHVLRAFYLLQIVKRYGPAPIVTQCMDDEIDFSDWKRSSVSQCADAIIEDCERAIAYGLMWEIGLAMPGENGRMTRAVAYAIESEAALFAASELWSNATSEEKTEKWRWAAQITGTALNECLNNDYKLYTVAPGADDATSQSAYQSYFFSKLDLSRVNDKETILESKIQLAMWRDAALPLAASSIRAGACPSQEMVDAYEMADGVSPFMTDDDGCVIYDGVNPRINPTSGYNPDQPYEGRDPRLAATIYYNGSLLDFSKPESALEIYKNGKCQLSDKELRYTRTGYYLRKFHNNRSEVNNQADGYIKIFRLAELYLNFAEAANEGYGPNLPVSDLEGPIIRAITAVNAVRSRAGMPNFDVDGMPNKAVFRKRCRNERRIELAFEQHRFYDVRRWKILDKTDRKITGMNLIKADDDTFNYSTARFALKERRCYESKFLLFPLPASEVSKMEKYTGTNWQNPQW